MEVDKGVIRHIPIIHTDLSSSPLRSWPIPLSLESALNLIHIFNKVTNRGDSKDENRRSGERDSSEAGLGMLERGGEEMGQE